VDCRRVTAMGRSALAGTPVRVENFRINDFAVEFDLFADERSQIEGAVDRVAREVGDVVTLRPLDGAEPSDITSAMERAKELFNQERFWEFHELLEYFWKKSAGTEKELLQGLILTAAAFVHHQKDEDDVCLTMLRKAKGKMRDRVAYHGIPIDHVSFQVSKILDTGEVQVFRLP